MDGDQAHIPYSETIDVVGDTAPWITMVHGASQDRRLFAAQVPAFQQDYRLLLIDLPGHGRSVAVPGPYGLEEYAAGVLAAMDRAGVESTHFWGTHTGAGVALLLASRHLERFRSLVLEGAVLPGVEMPSVTQEVGRARATARAHGIEVARTEWFNSAGWFKTIREHPQRCRAAEHWTIISHFRGGPWLDAAPAQPVAPISEQLSSIVRPVLLINGAHDLADFLRVADELEHMLPFVQRARIPDAGSFPLWEFPDRVNPLVRSFFEQQV